MLLSLGDLFYATFTAAKKHASSIAGIAVVIAVVQLFLWMMFLFYVMQQSAFALRDSGLEQEPAVIRAMLQDAVLDTKDGRDALQQELQILVVRKGNEEVQLLIDRIQQNDQVAVAEAREALQKKMQQFQELATTEPDTALMGSAEMETLLLDAQNGNTDALDLLTHQLQLSGFPEEQVRQQMGYRFAQEVPAIFVMLVVLILLSMFLNYLVQGAYLLLASSEIPMTLGSILSQGSLQAFPLMGVSLWSFVRSFVWAPFTVVLLAAVHPLFLVLLLPGILISIVLAVVFFPRFTLARAYLVREHLGIRAAVQRSYETSRGYWGKIVGNTLAWGLVITAVGLSLQMIVWALIRMSIGAVISSQSLFMNIILSLPQMFIAQVIFALGLFFIMQLAVNLAANPKRTIYDALHNKPNPVAPAAKTVVPVIIIPEKKAVAKKAPPKRKSAVKKSKKSVKKKQEPTEEA